MTEDDVAVLNLCTVDSRVANGETPPDRSVVRVNRLREEVNLSQLQMFAKERGQKIYHFAAKHDGPTISGIDTTTLLKLMFQVGEVQQLKGPGIFAFTEGIQAMLLQNTNTSAGLVNGMTGLEFAEEVILDVDVRGIHRALRHGLRANSSTASWIEIDDQFVLCTASLLCVLIRSWPHVFILWFDRCTYSHFPSASERGGLWHVRSSI